ncbi:MAG TPA: phospholipase D-like domain-containing protein, partial [Myxococcota bacterium]
GMIERAKKTLFLEQNSIRRRWGKRDDSSDPDSDKRDDDDSTPNLPLQAVVAAARRGVQVRVMLDSTWYNVQGDDERDNDDTVRWLIDLARTEKLDIDAKVINLETTHLEKIHAKGVIVDGQSVFVGSINWTENSFKGNREVGVIVGDAKIAGYYQGLFRRDWAASRIFSSSASANTSVLAAPGGKVIGHLARGDKMFIVGEHGNKDAQHAQWAELALPGLGQTGFVDESALGPVEATPAEALHVIGRDAVIVGNVLITDVNDHRIQLRFADEKRPPFTAVIFQKNEALFTAKGLSPSTAFQSHEVRVHGPVTMFRGPEIVINNPDQIEIIR